MTHPKASLSPAFWLVFGMTFLVFFAAFQLFPTVPLRLLELGATRGQTGQFLAFFTAGSALGALFTGPLGDRVGQRRMLVASALAFAAFMGIYATLRTPMGFYLLAFPHGVAWSGFLTANMAMVGRVLPPERRASGMSLFGLASPGGVTVGPVIGLAIFRLWGFPAVVLGMAGLFLVLAGLGFILPKDEPHAAHEVPPAFRLPPRSVLIPCAVLFATALGYGPLGTYTPQEALALKFPAFATSAFLTTSALGMVLMRLAMTRIGFGIRPVRMLPGMLAASCVGLFILALPFGGLARHIAAAILYGAGYSMVHTLVNIHVLEVAPPERRGAAFGATLFAFDSGIGLGSLFIGHSIGALGFSPGWLIGALAATVAMVPAVRMAKQ